MAFILASTNLLEKSFELELELVIAQIRNFSLEDSEPLKSCEEHKSDHGRQVANQSDHANPPLWFPNFWQIKEPVQEQLIANLNSTNISVAPELWKFMYKMLPNLQGGEFLF